MVPGRLLNMLWVVSFFVVCNESVAQDTTKTAAPPPSAAPAVTFEDGSLHFGKDIDLRFGALLQPSMELQQDRPTAAEDSNSSYNRRWQHQIFIRRMRFLFGGKVSRAFTFFFEFEAANVGRLATNTGSIGAKTGFPSAGNTAVMNLLDAQLSYIACQEFSVMAGLMLIGPTRNGIQGAATLMPVNYGAYTFVANAGAGNALDNAVGRDVGVMFRGFFHENRLEYRVSLSDGRARVDQAGNPQSLYSPLRFTTRLQYDIFDQQTPDIYPAIGGYFYTGTFLGKKKVLAIGAGLDMQRSYKSFAGDVFLDYPVNDGDGITVSVGYQTLNGGDPELGDNSFARLIPKQGIFFSEAGYFINSLKLQPVAKFEMQKVNGSNAQLGLSPSADPAAVTYLNDLRSSSRFGVGANYLPWGHNFNVKGMWELVSTTQAGLPSGAPFSEFKKSYSLFTFQGQWMFF